MATIDDGHDAQCTYNKCAHPESQYPCPFVRDEQLEEARNAVISLVQENHNHVWGVAKLRCACGAEHEL